MICLRHRWHAIGAQSGVRGVLGQRSDITLVLYRCARCNRMRQQQVLGHWTLKDMQA